MNALRVAERSATYELQTVTPSINGETFDLMATAPQGVAKLRELILSLAVRGKLVPQNTKDGSASSLLGRVDAEYKRLVARGEARHGKQLPPISNNELPFKIPISWAWARLGRLTNFGATDKATDVAEDTWVLDLEDIEKATSKLLRRVTFAERHSLSAKNAFRTDDVLYGKLRPYLNKVIVADRAGVCTTEILPFRCFGPSDASYFCVVLRSPDFLNYVNGKSYGMKMPRLGTEDGRRALIPLPPLAEQHRIVARVEELMGLCDELEAQGRLQDEQHAQLVSTLFDALATSTSPEELAANWQRVASHFDLLLDRLEAVDALEQTILQLAVRGLLVAQNPTEYSVATARKEPVRQAATGWSTRSADLSRKPNAPFMAPHGWEWVAFDTVVECLNGYAFKSEWFKPHGVRLVRNVNVMHGHLDWTDTACVDEHRAKEFRRFGLVEGDIVLTLDRPIISSGLKLAEIRPADLPCLLLQRVAKLTPRAGLITHRFLMLWLCSSHFLSALDPGRSNGVPHISTRQIGAIPFALPPIPEQHRIVARVEELRGLCAGLRQCLQQARATHSNLADAVVAHTAAELATRLRAT